MKFKIGDRVIINGYLYKSSNATSPSGSVKNKETTITRIAKGSKHPYNTTGDLGWMDESAIKLKEEPKPDKPYEMEIELVDINGLINYLEENKNKVIIIKQEDLEKVLK